MRTLHPFRFSAFALLLGLAAGCDRTAPELPTGAAARAPGTGLAPLRLAADPIAGRYLVVLKPTTESSTSDVRQLAAANATRVHYTYDRAIQGFAATLTPAAVERLRHDPRVDYVAQDGWAYTTTTQTGATWGLDRVDQRNLPLNTTYVYGATGAGVRVYVIDSGIRTTHAQFGGRASVGADFVNDGHNGQDCLGHGTHVAGTIAGATYGVAKGAQVVAVRVYGCTDGGPWSTVIAAVDWVTAHAQKPAVVNMSLGGSFYAPANQAVQASIASGLVYTVSAGNNSADACLQSPAATPEAITVGASTSGDARASFSNMGSCVDIFAPGEGITSSWYTGDGATNVLSGTSMASPHVAGVAALVLQGTPAATPAAVAAKIASTGTHNHLTGIGTGSPNNLLFSGLTVEAPAPAIGLAPGSLTFSLIRPAAGTAAAAVSAARLTGTFRASGAGEPRADAAAVPGTEVAATGSTASSRVVLSNTGTAALTWTATSSQTWLKADPANGLLGATYSTILNATANAGTLAPGTYTGAVTVGGSGATKVLPVTMNVAEARVLTHGVPRTALAGAAGSQAYFMVQVPANATRLTVSMSGGTGDADLYVRYGDPPNLSTYDCRPYTGGNVESCDLALPMPGIYYVMLRGYGAYTGVSLTAAVGGPPAAPASLVAAPASSTAVKLTWADASVNETTFTLDRSAKNGSGVYLPYQTVATPAANATTNTNTGVAGSTYRYRIRACNAAGCSAWASSAAITLPGVTPPSALTAVATGATSARVAWTDASTNETSFTVQRRIATGATTWGAWATVGTPAANTGLFNNTGLLAAKRYQYQVRACSATACSAWVVSAAVTTPAA